MSDAEFGALLETLGYAFTDEGLLREAVTHSSWANEHPGEASNERLEFMGDAVLGFVVAGELFRRFPSWDEGLLTAAKAHLVGKDNLQEIARRLRLSGFLRVGAGERRADAFYPPSMGINALEAIIGAVFMDGGIEAARGVILGQLIDQIEAMETEGVPEDPKSQLQALSLRRFARLPSYRLAEQSGPDHERTYVFSVTVADGTGADGEGPSKKDAQKNAARNLLKILEPTET